MKTQLSKPARSKARYTDQYKQEALELWRASGRSAAKVAAELGIRPPPKPAPPSSLTSRAFYNRTRLHSSLDYQSPINFESKLNGIIPSSLSEKTGQAHSDPIA